MEKCAKWILWVCSEKHLMWHIKGWCLCDWLSVLYLIWSLHWLIEDLWQTSLDVTLSPFTGLSWLVSNKFICVCVLVVGGWGCLDYHNILSIVHVTSLVVLWAHDKWYLNLVYVCHMFRNPYNSTNARFFKTGFWCAIEQFPVSMNMQFNRTQ